MLWVSGSISSSVHSSFSLELATSAFRRGLMLLPVSLAACSLVGSIGAPAARAADDPGLVVTMPVQFPFTPPEGAAILPGLPATRGSGLDFSVVAQLPGMYNWNAAFGDADHDGRREVCCVVYDNVSHWYHTRFIEHQGSNVYTTEAEVPYYYPFAMGDFDRDGLTDVLAQLGAYVQVYEASSPSGYPDHLAWQSPALMNIIGYPTTGDSDGDGFLEIIQSVNFFSGPAALVIFEHTGADNQYVQRFYATTSSGVGREKQVADLDGDGRAEIFIGADDGKVHVFEAFGPTWTQTATINVEGVAVTGVEAGADVDHDGRRELYASGSSATGWQTRVFEADGDNSYVPDGQAVRYDNYFGLCFNELRDFDGDGELELMMSGGAALYFFERNLGWSLASQIDDPDGGTHSAAFADDLNSNGRAEAIWQLEVAVESNLKTLVYETGAPTDVAPGAGSALFTAWPNPTRGDARLLLRLEREQPVTFETLDVAGRVLSRRLSLSPALEWSGADLRAGVYYVRAVGATGAPLGTRQLELIR